MHACAFCEWLNGRPYLRARDRSFTGPIRSDDWEWASLLDINILNSPPLFWLKTELTPNVHDEDVVGRRNGRQDGIKCLVWGFSVNTVYV